MQFLSSGVLWALFALAIPVIVHLFNFRRTKKVFFSNVALLKTVETTTSSIRKLKHLLILASRLLFLTCLILAFAQPVWNANKKDIKPTGLNGIYIDNSMSMEQILDNKKYLDLAIIKVEELLSVFHRKSNIQMGTNDFEPQDQYTMTSSKVKDRLTTIKFSEKPRTLDQIYKRQHGIAIKNNPSAQNNFFMFSDFQKSTLGDLIKVEANDKVNLIPIASPSVSNVFVDSIWLGTPMVREMQNNTLFVKMRNSGQKEIENLPLKLYLDGVQSSTSSINIKPNQQAVAKFNFTLQKAGQHAGSIQFDDQPISFDNEYFFVLNASPKIKIIHLYGQKPSENYIAKMYTNDSLFEYNSYSLGTFDIQQASRANLVVLEGITDFNPNVVSSLLSYVKSGGSVCVIPEENMNMSNLAALLAPLGLNQIAKTNNSPEVENFLEVKEPDKSLEFWSDVFENGTFNGITNLPRSTPMLQWSGGQQKLITFKNGQNYFSKSKLGAGNFYFFASPINKKWGGFGEHAYFVPSFFKMAALSSKLEKVSYDFNDEEIKLFIPDAPKNASYKLKKGKMTMIPNHRFIDNFLYLSLPSAAEIDNSLQSGYYDLEIDGKKYKTLALNHDSKESNIDSYTVADLKEMYKNQANVQIFDSIYDAGFKTEFDKSNEAKPLWKYFIVLSLLFLLAEILLSRFLKT